MAGSNFGGHIQGMDTIPKAVAELFGPELAEKVFIAARYMATQGPVFGEGHTLSFTGGEAPEARILFDWSGLGGISQPIFQLRLLQLEEGA